MGAEIDINDAESTVTVRGGTRGNISAVVDRIKEIAGLWETADEDQCTSIQLLPKEVGAIIGTKGTVIKEFRKRHSQCRVDVDSEKLIVRISTVRKRGREEKRDGDGKECEENKSEAMAPVMAARKDIMSTLQKESEGDWKVQRAFEFQNGEQPFKHVASAIVGRKGDMVSKIEADCRCQVNVVRAAEKILLRAETEEDLLNGEAAIKAVLAAHVVRDLQDSRKQRGQRERRGKRYGADNCVDRDRGDTRAEHAQLAVEPEASETDNGEEQELAASVSTSVSTRVPGASVQVSKNARRRAARKARKKEETFRRVEE